MLALFEWALSQDLKVDQYIQQMNCLAEESMRSTDQNNRIAAINLFVTRLLKGTIYGCNWDISDSPN